MLPNIVLLFVSATTIQNVLMSPDIPLSSTTQLNDTPIEKTAEVFKKVNQESPCRLSSAKPADCEELFQLGYNKSGVYSIWPRNKILHDKSLEVFCDMETDSGGWTLLQRRGNFLRPNDYFYKDWKSYKEGFGDIEKDFWLGNDFIFSLTNQRAYSVRFDLTDVEGEHRFAVYDTFFIENEENKYRLHIQDYSGTAADSVIKWHNMQHFSTKDQDNENNEINCAATYKGGWWYNSCHASNLNGLYLRGKHESYADGVIWSLWKGPHESLDKTEIKIRPKDFRKTKTVQSVTCSTQKCPVPIS